MDVGKSGIKKKSCVVQGYVSYIWWSGLWLFSLVAAFTLSGRLYIQWGLIIVTYLVAGPFRVGTSAARVGS